MRHSFQKASSALIAAASGFIFILGTLLTHGPTPSAIAQNSTPTVTPTRATKLRALLKGSTNKSTDPNGNVLAEVRLPNEGATWSGNAFELDLQQDANLKFRFRVSRLNPDMDNLETVYDHTENNRPFCPFGDSNGRCQSLPELNGMPWWPDSDAGSAQPVAAGNYVLEVKSAPKSDGENGNWQRDLGSNNAIFFTIDLQQFEDAPVELPRQTGRAAIVSPRNDSVLRGIVNIRGSATSNNFAYYKFEFEDARCANGVCFVADGKRAVANGTLLRWDTRTVPNGTYLMRLVVVDRFGRQLSQVPRIQVTIAN